MLKNGRSNFLKNLIYTVNVYKAIALASFILFYTLFSREYNSVILITVVLSDFLTMYLIKAFKLDIAFGKLLVLFSSEHCKCVLLIFLLIENYASFPLLLIFAKEVFCLSFSDMQVNYVDDIVGTGGMRQAITLGALCFIALFHVNEVCLSFLNTFIVVLCILEAAHFVYAIALNADRLGSYLAGILHTEDIDSDL